MNIDEKYMRRAIQLAKSGNGSVSPNPMVGAVIVANGRIIGEGFHRRFGEAHAEVNAINSLKESDVALLEKATLYVTLEPCSHYGKTPPCSELIIHKKIPRIVTGSADPFKEVSGRGIRMLREARCDVVCGIMEKECMELNEKFMTAHILHRPYILLKWAESSDRMIDRTRKQGETPARFSTAATTSLVHKLRSEYDAIMTGTNTVILDNPSLTVRQWNGRNPLRVTIDNNGRIPSTSKILTDGNPTLIFTRNMANPNYIKVPEKAETLEFICSRLYANGITSLMVEGGTTLLQAFIDRNLWDETRIERNSRPLGSGMPAPSIPQGIITEERTDGNLIIHIKNRKTAQMAIQ